MFYLQDNTTRKQVRLRTKDKVEAKRLAMARNQSRNQSFEPPALTISMAKG